MTLTTYDPWKNLPTFSRFADALFDRAVQDYSRPGRNGATGWLPAVDIREEEKAYVIQADIPGVEPKDIDVSFEDGALTVRGERKSERKEDKEGYHLVERSHGVFERRFSLPDSVDSEGIKAVGKNGVLEITIPKKDNVVTKKIPVN